MRYLLFLGFAASFAGADCGTPSPLTRSCPGSTPVTLRYYVVQGCEAENGYVNISVGTANDCTINVVEPTAVQLPTVGSFNDLASQTGYQLAKGNWNLQDPTMQGNVVAGNSYQCTGRAATASGDITLDCIITSCVQGADDIQCNTAGTCNVHLTPAALDAGTGPSPVMDAGAPG